MEDMSTQHERELKKRMYKASVQKSEAVRKQAEDDLRLTAINMVRERQIRLKQLDETRSKLNALKIAFSKRSNETNLSHDSHKLTMAVLSIKDKTDQGLPFAEALDMLGPIAADDEFIATVISSIPPLVAKEGAMTNIQLQKWFWEVEHAATKVALLPEEGAGLLSHILSHAAALVRVKEDEASEADASIESTFSVARKLISERRFFESAALLEKHFGSTAASSIIGPWIKAARERATIDQAVKVLEASATTKARSLT